MWTATLVIGAVCVLGRAEDHEDDELLLDVVEPVFHVRADEHHRSGLHGAILAADPDPPRPETT